MSVDGKQPFFPPPAYSPRRASAALVATNPYTNATYHSPNAEFELYAQVDEYSLPPSFTELPRLDKLVAVHDIILQHFSDIEPLKALTLSSEVYDIVVPYVYRHVKASKGLMAGLEFRSKAWKRKQKALSCVKVLEIDSMEEMWRIAMLGYKEYSNLPRQYTKLFPEVRKVVIAKEVITGIYVMKREGEPQRTWSMEELRAALRLQLPPMVREVISPLPPETGGGSAIKTVVFPVQRPEPSRFTSPPSTPISTRILSYFHCYHPQGQQSQQQQQSGQQPGQGQATDRRRQSDVSSCESEHTSVSSFGLPFMRTISRRRSSHTAG
ncbi:hypothetical protein I315_01884 [Cryptococcus gattii Ru294]|uniref:Uncharacterized protein n=2 Tax=Cryptococcus gattii TaxID=37769 RepID=E6R2K4_CRYGW|nr:Hypothetical Protein CGB_C0240W [Cryptococcus gattii WM276]KIR55298.1 hypothetical protein I315_01884 [Cryptococcus gattii Ru294]KIR82382.1 hypothetical protein I306_00529 [Cryptococcus gattii EJB2]KIY33233.1 hypothetical protein I305_04099 [Cryptococcus gattii E566]KJE03559.1 hypothetical protein I311_02599 [Cryptococcus gattii NT-10]ADV20723.1 Hypothetical Protein CGB_C0240W [Cryptococcus gattii WM276]